MPASQTGVGLPNKGFELITPAFLDIPNHTLALLFKKMLKKVLQKEPWAPLFFMTF